MLEVEEIKNVSENSEHDNEIKITSMSTLSSSEDGKKGSAARPIRRSLVHFDEEVLPPLPSDDKIINEEHGIELKGGPVLSVREFEANIGLTKLSHVYEVTLQLTENEIENFIPFNYPITLTTPPRHAILLHIGTDNQKTDGPPILVIKLKVSMDKNIGSIRDVSRFEDSFTFSSTSTQFSTRRVVLKIRSHVMGALMGKPTLRKGVHSIGVLTSSDEFESDSDLEGEDYDETNQKEVFDKVPEEQE